MKNILIIMLVICTLFLQTSCASTQKRTQPFPDTEYSDELDEIFPCSEKTPPPDKLSDKQIEFLNKHNLYERYMEECINGPEQKRKREAEKYNPPTQKEAWIADLAGCRLYVKPSFFTGWLATPAPGTKIDILGKVKGQFGFSFYLIEYTVPENQVMKGYVADAYVTTEKPKKPYMGGVCSHICMGLPFF